MKKAFFTLFSLLVFAGLVFGQDQREPLPSAPNYDKKVEPIPPIPERQPIPGAPDSPKKVEPIPPILERQPIPAAPDVTVHNFWHSFNGQWIPDADPSVIGAENYKTLQNLRYTDGGLEGVQGYTKINTSVVNATNLKIRNGHQLKKDEPAETHVLVQAYNAGLTESKIYDNSTAIPNQGNFTATELHTDASGAGIGRFASGAQGSVFYCNGVESMIYSGDESRCAAFITSSVAITDTVTDPRDYTEKVQNKIQTDGEFVVIGGANDSYTELLLRMDGADESTGFADSSSNNHANTPAGNAQMDVDQKKFGTASGLFDGDGDYVSYADHADWNWGTGALTIDFWVRFDTVTGIHTIWKQKDTTAGDMVWLYVDHENNTLNFRAVDGGVGNLLISLTETWNPAADIWYHVAVIRGWGGSSDSWAMTVDGTILGSADTDTDTMPDHDQAITIAGGLTAATDIFDFGPTAHVITLVNNAVLSTTQEKWGNASLYYDGTDDRMTTPNHADWDLTTESTFTIDLWVKHTDHVGTEIYVGHYEDADTFWYFGHIDGTGLTFYLRDDAGELINIAGTEITNTLWHHVQVAKYGNFYGIYLDGTRVAYEEDASSLDITGLLCLGSLGNDTLDFDGYMDDVRITHADISVAGYLPGGITPPTTPHTSDSDTKLLIRADTYDFDGWMDEFRLSKGIARWEDNFTPSVRSYLDDSRFFVVGSTKPLQGIKPYISNGNTVSSPTISGTYWNGVSWTDLVNLTDNTSGLASTETITWDSTVDTAKPKHLEGLYLYVYQFELSAGNATIYYVTVDAPFQKVVDIWDGVFRQPTQFQVNKANVWADYTLEVNTETENNDYPFIADVGGLLTTDEIIVVFDDRITAIKYQMFAGKTNDTASVQSIHYFDGLSYVAVPNLVDLTLDDAGSTDTWNKTGVVSWTPPDENLEFPREVFGFYGYAYKITVSATVGVDTHIDVVTGIPAQLKIKPFKFPARYKNRTMLCGFTQSNEGNRVDYSLPNAPDVFNGEETSNGGVYSLYFGGEQEITAATELYNRFGSNIFSTFVVLKDTETYLLMGSTPYIEDPDRFRIFPISYNIGCPAPLTLATAELGYEVAEDAQRNVAIWLSYSGPMLFDGAVMVPLKGIDKYFDPAESVCINFDYIDVARGAYDQTNKEYNLLIPSGTSQTTNNVWLVYDLVRKKWYEKVPATYPQSLFPVTDTSGARYMYGGLDTGYMMHIENGNTWDGTGIEQIVETGDFFPTNNSPWYQVVLRRVKLAGIRITEDIDVAITHYADTSSSGTSLTVLALDSGSNRITRATQNTNILAWSHRFKFSSTTSNTAKGIRLTGWGMQYRVEREDLVESESYNMLLAENEDTILCANDDRIIVIQL